MQRNIEERLHEIMDAKKEFHKKYLSAKNEFKELVEEQELILKSKDNTGLKNVNLKKNIRKIKKIVDIVHDTEPLLMNSLKSFLSSEDYLFHHSLNVCYIGTAILKRFNTIFSSNINKMLNESFSGTLKDAGPGNDMFKYYSKIAIDAISMGYFIHDLGKLMLPESLLDKKKSLNREELREIQKHSYEYGVECLNRNGILNTYIENIVKFHHAALYTGEKRSYPEQENISEIPPYVKICKIADQYSAMTMKRSYGEAMNPIKAVNTIFRQYSGKSPILQLILYSFVQEAGVHPVGSILILSNRQLAYVINNDGPEVLIFTDSNGNTIEKPGELINLSCKSNADLNLGIDTTKLPQTPIELFDSLPKYLKEFHILMTNSELKS